MILAVVTKCNRAVLVVLHGWHKAMFMALCLSIGSGCQSFMIDRRGIEGISVLEVRYPNKTELRVQSRQIGGMPVPAGCEFYPADSIENDWLLVHLMELSPSGESPTLDLNCHSQPEFNPEDSAGVRKALLAAAAQYVTDLSKMFDLERSIWIEFKLVPAVYDYTMESRIDPDNDPIHFRASIAMDYDENFEFQLARALSVLIHEMVHVLAHKSGYFDSSAEEEFFAYTLERCFRIRTVNDLDYWAPNVDPPPSEENIDEVMSNIRQAQSVKEIVAQIDGSDSVKGLGLALTLFAWAVREREVVDLHGHDDRQLLDMWCDLVLYGPNHVLEQWPEI